jgi:superfamily II DNA or RNA helicase
VRQLRDYQEEAGGKLSSFLSTGTGALADLCVGAGKSLTSLYVIYLLLESGVIDRSIIITPRTDIRRQFSESTNKPEKKEWSTSRGIVVLPEVQELESGGALTRFFDESRTVPQKVGVCTYDVFRNQYEELVRNHTWERTLMVVDEGHHVYDGPEKGKTAASIEAIREAGAKSLQLTGTAVRSDGKEVHLRQSDGSLDPVFIRSLLQHMAEGWTPELRAKIIPITGKGTRDSGTFDMPEEVKGFRAIADDIVECGRPLSIIRIRCQDVKANRRIREGMKEELNKRGLKVIIHISQPSEEDGGWEEEEDRWKELTDLLSSSPSYEEIQKVVNVVIVHQKLNEGVDLPAFSHMYLWGIPYSVPLIEQLLGRVMRLRFEDNTRRKPLFLGYPEAWQDVSQLAFCMASVNTNNLGHREAELMHQLGAWMHSLEAGCLLGRLARYDDRLKGIRTLVKKGGTKSFLDGLEVLNEAQSFVNATWDPLGTDREGLVACCGVRLIEERHPENEWEARKKAFRFARGLQNKNASEIVESLDEMALDPGVQEILKKALQEFITEAKDDDSDWIFRGSQYDHYEGLVVKTGGRSKEEEIIVKVKLFLAAEGRLPGAYPHPLNRDKVPGEIFCFSQYSRAQWRETFLKTAYPNREEWLQEIHDLRVKWGREGSTLTRFREMRKNQRNPILSYCHPAIWVRVSSKWLDQLELSDVAELGKWSVGGIPAKRIDDNEANLELIELWVGSHSPEELIGLIRRGKLSSLREP